jgi:hypothetical protein
MQGVSRSSDGKKFVAWAHVDGRRLRFGTFDTADEARAAYRAFLVKRAGEFCPRELQEAAHAF